MCMRVLLCGMEPACSQTVDYQSTQDPILHQGMAVILDRFYQSVSDCMPPCTLRQALDFNHVWAKHDKTRQAHDVIILWSSSVAEVIPTSPPYKSEKLVKSCTSVATSAEQAELFRVVREGQPIPESTCWPSPGSWCNRSKNGLFGQMKKHVFLWKLARTQEKDWAKGYPKVSPILPFSLPVMLHLWQYACVLAIGEEFPGWNLKSSWNPLCGAPPNKSTSLLTSLQHQSCDNRTSVACGNENFGLYWTSSLLKFREVVWFQKLR